LIFHRRFRAQYSINILVKSGLVGHSINPFKIGIYLFCKTGL